MPCGFSLWRKRSLGLAYLPLSRSPQPWSTAKNNCVTMEMKAAFTISRKWKDYVTNEFLTPFSESPQKRFVHGKGCRIPLHTQQFHTHPPQ